MKIPKSGLPSSWSSRMLTSRGNEMLTFQRNVMLTFHMSRMLSFQRRKMLTFQKSAMLIRRKGLLTSQGSGMLTFRRGGPHPFRQPRCYGGFVGHIPLQRLTLRIQIIIEKEFFIASKICISAMLATILELMTCVVLVCSQNGARRAEVFLILNADISLALDKSL